MTNKTLTVGQRVRIVSETYRGRTGTVASVKDGSPCCTVRLDDIGTRPFFTSECEPA